jgi:hypothetical protein
MQSWELGLDGGRTKYNLPERSQIEPEPLLATLLRVPLRLVDLVK